MTKPERPKELQDWLDAEFYPMEAFEYIQQLEKYIAYLEKLNQNDRAEISK